jgi:hypothetical protein
MEGRKATIRLQDALSAADAKELDRCALVERLVEQGATRLTADRMAAILKGESDTGRARRHAQARH